jgi:uncharacterized protein with NRDE domain
MCLILFAVDPDPKQHLVVVANRDEQHSRATARADFWQDQSNLLAGRDLVAGGTWLGVNKNGRFAAVTNFAEIAADPLPPRSRGELTADFLNGEMPCQEYLKDVLSRAQEYRGFNLLLSDGRDVYYFSNRNNDIQRLQRGYYGLSNQLLDCDWPKVISGRNLLEQQLSSRQLANQEERCDNTLSENLFKLLAYQGNGAAHTARFILGDTYGTSVSTVVELGIDTINFEERGFDPKGHATGTVRHSLTRNG